MSSRKIPSSHQWNVVSENTAPEPEKKDDNHQVGQMQKDEGVKDDEKEQRMGMEKGIQGIEPGVKKAADEQ